MADETTTKAPPDDGLIARLASQRARFRDQASTLGKERDALKTERDRLIGELAELKKTADTSVAVKRVAELEGKLRDHEHRKTFDKVAKLKGASEQALDDLWTLSGYKAEAEAVDEAALGTLIDGQKTARPYLFGANGVNTPPPGVNTPPVKPGPGSGQGGSITGTTTFSQDQLSDPKFVMANFEAISQAASDRMKRGEI